MKNVKVLFAALAVSAFLFASCGETCSTCTYDLGGVTTEVEFCGSKGDVNDFEEATEATAALGGATATCERD
jgi:hypothetical protein